MTEAINRYKFSCAYLGYRVVIHATEKLENPEFIVVPSCATNMIALSSIREGLRTGRTSKEVLIEKKTKRKK